MSNAQIVQFDQYRINIPLRLPETSTARMQKSALTMRELLEDAQQPGSDTTKSRRMLIEFHKRLVLPVGCLMMSLLGLPLGLQARPGKKAIGIQAGLAIFILYYILFTFGKALAEDGVLPVWLAMWVPNFLFFSLAIFWIIRVSNEQPLIPEVISRFFARIFAAIMFPLKTLCRPLLYRLKVLYKKTYPHEERK
jgi:lipopolysaccharide export system permease protein